MDVFGVHQQLIDEYRSFTTGVVDVRDPRIKQHVAEELARGEQEPEPWLSLNPMFAPGGSIDALVRAGLLYAECGRVFSAKRKAHDTKHLMLRASDRLGEVAGGGANR